MKLLRQLSTVSRNAVTWGKIFALVKQGTCKKTQHAGGKTLLFVQIITKHRRRVKGRGLYMVELNLQDAVSLSTNYETVVFEARYQ